jgi:hypothetical protein
MGSDRVTPYLRDPDVTLQTLELVADERDRQELLVREGSLVYTAAHANCPDVLRLAALVEEVGEVARAVHEGDLENLAVELVQVAAVAVAWREAL